jgi:hypothetical protein
MRKRKNPFCSPWMITSWSPLRLKRKKRRKGSHPQAPILLQ